MTESDIKLLIRKEIREALAPVLMGLISSNTDNNRSSVQRLPTEFPINKLRNIQPYGVSSRAPVGTQCLTIPISSDPTHINLVGHFDEARPTTNDGESILYDAYGHIIYLSKTKMQFGSKASANPMMLGDIVQSCLSQFLDLVANHVHICAPAGYDSAPPETKSDFLSLKSSPVDDGKIISDKCFTEK